MPIRRTDYEIMSPVPNLALCCFPKQCPYYHIRSQPVPVPSQLHWRDSVCSMFCAVQNDWLSSKTKVCANTLCRYCKIVPVNDAKKIVWRNLFGLCFTHTKRIFWLINYWKNQSSSSRKWRRRIFILKKIDLFASQCTISVSNRQAELKYIILDKKKSFLRCGKS